jgi:hypothetical protein
MCFWWKRLENPRPTAPEMLLLVEVEEVEIVSELYIRPGKRNREGFQFFSGRTFSLKPARNPNPTFSCGFPLRNVFPE